MSRNALIFGVGSGISASFARVLAREGYRLAVASRHKEKLDALAAETGALSYSADVSRIDHVASVFESLDREFDRLDVVLYNAGQRMRGPIAQLAPSKVSHALNVTAFGGFLVGQEAARRMLKQGDGAILFTGASASVKGYPQSAAFAMGKFALRGLAQSMARELAPKGIHVAHFVIDGQVRSEEGGRIEGKEDQPDSMLDPDAIAETYLQIVRQPRSAWTWEVELRPWVETF